MMQNSVLDRQVEHRDAVTLVGSHVMVGALNDRARCTCLFGCYIEPVVIVFVVETNRIVDVLGRCVINRQMQRINLRATVRIKVTVGVVSTLRVNRSVPSEVPARGLRKGGVHGMEDGQVQGINARTVVGVRVLVDVCAALGVSRSMPSIILADGEAFSIMGAVMDGQMQRHSAVSPVNVLILTRVIARLRVGLAIPIVTLTRRGRELVGRGVVHGKVEGIYLGAAVAVGARIVVGSRLRVGLAGAVRPRVAVEGRLDEAKIRRIVNGQVEGIDLRAPVRIVVDVGVVAALGIGCAFPSKALASRLGKRQVGRVVDGQMQGIDLCALVGIFVDIGVVARGGVSLAVAARPGVGTTFRNGDGVVCRVVDGQMQGIDLCAPVGIGMTVGIVVALRVFRVVPSKTLACHLGERQVCRVLDRQQ